MTFAWMRSGWTRLSQADLYAEEHGPMLAGAKIAVGNGSQYDDGGYLRLTAHGG